MKTTTPGQPQALAAPEESGTAGAMPSAAEVPAPQTLTGRAVFAVDTAASGIVVRTAFLPQQGPLVDMPAVFPDLAYALQQIDHLRQIVIDRFAQAAQVGVQVIAVNAAAAETGDQAAGDAASPLADMIPSR